MSKKTVKDIELTGKKVFVRCDFNVPMDEVERVKQIVVNEMQNVVHLSIPLIADCGVGKNWFEAH